MSKMAPELPHASARALEALDETVVTLKALQKSFVLRGSVKEVREEEAKREPAQENKQENKDENEEGKTEP
jgi:phospholipid/cholesterol/gamma-HCH transport system substrate-binding protein